MPELDLRGLPVEVKLSAVKLSRYAHAHDCPKCDADWPALPATIGVPAEHLIVLFARLYGVSEEKMRRLIQAPGRLN
jgi:hypothetical protein